MTDKDNEMIASLKGFTPGPWVRGPLTGSDLDYEDDESEVEVFCAFGFCVHSQTLGFDDEVDAQITANAALIAAAPDLHRIATKQAAEIARLRRCLSGLLGFHDGEPMTWVESERRIDAARAALAAKP